MELEKVATVMIRMPARTQSKETKQELALIAREQTDVLAFADKNCEIEELPEGLETGYVMRRQRGSRTDRDCIDEICELIAQGITVMASTRYVGVRYATWHKWTKFNHEQAQEKYEFAHLCHLDAMADRTLQIYEDLKALRESEMSKFVAEHDAWRAKVDNLQEGERRPVEPVYRGPTEWELSLAEKRVSVHGSASIVKTIGMTEVACLNAGTAVPNATMTSTLSRTNSAAISA